MSVSLWVLEPAVSKPLLEPTQTSSISFLTLLYIRWPLPVIDLTCKAHASVSLFHVPRWIPVKSITGNNWNSCLSLRPITKCRITPICWFCFSLLAWFGVGDFIVCVVVCFSFVLFETEPHCLVQDGVAPTIIVSFPSDLGIGSLYLHAVYPVSIKFLTISIFL